MQIFWAALLCTLTPNQSRELKTASRHCCSNSALPISPIYPVRQAPDLKTPRIQSGRLPFCNALTISRALFLQPRFSPFEKIVSCGAHSLGRCHLSHSEDVSLRKVPPYSVYRQYDIYGSLGSWASYTASTAKPALLQIQCISSPVESWIFMPGYSSFLDFMSAVVHLVHLSSFPSGVCNLRNSTSS